MTKAAFLILAHDQPEAVSRLISSLTYPGFTFFVHIDGNANDSPFRAAIGARDDVCFVPRIPVNWMGYSMVEATLTLMRHAHQEGNDYYTLLSGADYPLKPNSEIVRTFSRSDKHYLSYWHLEDRPSWLHKVHYYYPIEFIPIRNYRQTVLRRLFWGTFIKIRGVFPKRSYPSGLTPFGGSQWWSLNHACVDYVLKFVARRPDFTNFYRWTHAPDEGFFQSIIMNSEFAPSVNGYADYLSWRALVNPATTNQTRSAVDELAMPGPSPALRYIDFTGELTGTREVPAILDDRDFCALTSSGALFARKFDPKRSANLLTMIDLIRG